MAAKPNFHVDAHFPNSKEMLTMARRYRLPATGAFTAAGCWSCDKLTDGWVPVRALVELLVTPLLTDLLIASTLWIPAEDDARGSVTWTTQVGPVEAVQFENWERWQITKARWEKGNKSNAKRQADFRERRSREFDELKSRVDNTLLLPGHRHDNDTSANPSNTLPTSAGEERRGEEVVKLERDSPVGSDPANPLPEFPDHCATHRHTPEPPACVPCRNQRVANANAAQQAADIASVQAVAERDREKRRAAQCPDCRGNGWVLDMWGEPLEPAVKCQHPQVAG